MKKILIILLFVSCGNPPPVTTLSVKTSKVLTIYPNAIEYNYENSLKYPFEKTISLFTDFTNIEKCQYSGCYIPKGKVTLDSFNTIETKVINIRGRSLEPSYRTVRLPQDNTPIIEEGKIYFINDVVSEDEYNRPEIEVGVFNNKYNLKSVWEFGKGGDFIYNKTGRTLYVKPTVYSPGGGVTNRSLETKKIAPNQIIKSPLPDYFFENSPPFSITSNHSYTETRYWVFVLD